MTKPLPFTEQSIRRAIRAVRQEGLEIKATTIHADGAVTIYHDADAVAATLAGERAREHNDAEGERWRVEA